MVASFAQTRLARELVSFGQAQQSRVLASLGRTRLARVLERFGRTRLAREFARSVAPGVVLGLAGLQIQVIGYAAGWYGHNGVAIVLWPVGFLLIVCPFAALALNGAHSARSLLGISLAFTAVMHASWFLTSPLLATRFDETLHVTSLLALVENHRLFSPNPTLPISPYYPALQLATGGVFWLTGLPLIACQLIVVLIARIGFSWCLFGLATRISGSPRVGAVAVVLYAASPQSYFFNAQFAYQTMAIALVVGAFLLLARIIDERRIGRRARGSWIAVSACLAVLAGTHHLTSWLALMGLWFLAVVLRVGGQRAEARCAAQVALIGTGLVVLWTAIVSPLLWPYLRGIFGLAFQEFIVAFDGGGVRQPGVGPGGARSPRWEVLMIGASIGAWGLLGLPSVWQSWRGSILGRGSARYVLMLVAVTYPVLIISRISSKAAEVGDRASTFVFMATSIVVGAWIVALLRRRSPPCRRVLTSGFIPVFAVLLLGGTIFGSGSDWARVPGPYLPGAQQRSIDATTLQAAQWAGERLPAGSRFISDWTLTRLLPNFAPIVPVTSVHITPIFLAQTVNAEVLGLLRSKDVDFIIVDTRIEGQRLLSGSWFYGSSGYGPPARSFSARQLNKFADVPGIDLVRGGTIRVYDVRPLLGRPATFANRPPPGLPGTWRPWQAVLTLVLVGAVLLTWGQRSRRGDIVGFGVLDGSRPVVMLVGLVFFGLLGTFLKQAPVAGAAVALVLAAVAVRALRGPVEQQVGDSAVEVSETASHGAGWVWLVSGGALAAGSIALALVSAWSALGPGLS